MRRRCRRPGPSGTGGWEDPRCVRTNVCAAWARQKKATTPTLACVPAMPAGSGSAGFRAAHRLDAVHVFVAKADTHGGADGLPARPHQVSVVGHRVVDWRVDRKSTRL